MGVVEVWVWGREVEILVWEREGREVGVVLV